MSIIDKMKQRAKADVKTIVLPESMDIRILKATEIMLKEKTVNIVLLGNEEQINKKAQEGNIDISNAKIIDPMFSDKVKEYGQILCETDDSITIEEATELAKNPGFFGMLMVKAGDCDGYVSGAMNTTKDILKKAMKIFKKQGTRILSTALLIIIPENKELNEEERVFVFSDCGLNENPGYLALSEIAVSSARTYEKFAGEKAKVAMLSYSSFGSAKSKYTEKVKKATDRVKEKHPEIIVDGEIQLDAAIVPEVAKLKAKDSKIQGDANVLIFPDINSGNIGCKLVERLAGGALFGPICQGLEKPINDLSRGCTVDGIIGTVLITAIQAQ